MTTQGEELDHILDETAEMAIKALAESLGGDLEQSVHDALDKGFAPLRNDLVSRQQEIAQASRDVKESLRDLGDGLPRRLQESLNGFLTNQLLPPVQKDCQRLGSALAAFRATLESVSTDLTQTLPKKVQVAIEDVMATRVEPMLARETEGIFQALKLHRAVLDHNSFVQKKLRVFGWAIIAGLTLNLLVLMLLLLRGQ